jgi:CBS domain containing-hemolysin-like protein
MSAHQDQLEAAAGSRRAPESPLSALVGRLRNLLGLAHASLREDIEDALDETAGDVTPHERALLKNVLALHDLRVADAMIPRADIVAIEHGASLRDVLAVFRNQGHSRLPVYVETLDDPRGMVHIRDFVNYLAARAETARSVSPDASAQEKEETRNASVALIDFSAPLSSANILKPVLFVPRSMPALDLLVRMQSTRTHMALVIDEYGGTDGLVSIEDIVEMIVGDIEDEHDVPEKPTIIVLPNGDFLIDAKADLDEVQERLGVDFRLEDTPQEEATTLGGLVAWLAGRVPMRGEIMPAPVEGWEFEILDADPRRIARLRVRRREPKGETEE